MAARQGVFRENARPVLRFRGIARTERWGEAARPKPVEKHFWRSWPGEGHGCAPHQRHLQSWGQRFSRIERAVIDAGGHAVDLACWSWNTESVENKLSTFVAQYSLMWTNNK